MYLDEKIEKYIVDIVFATRYPEKYDLKELKTLIGFGGSAPCFHQHALAARSYAFIKRRGYVIRRMCAVARRTSPPYRLDLRGGSQQYDI